MFIVVFIENKNFSYCVMLNFVYGFTVAVKAVGDGQCLLSS